MQQEKKAEKSIVDHIKNEELYLLIPNISLGKFELRKKITEYNLGKHEFISKDSEEDIWDTYELFDPELSLFTDKENNICSIRCNYKCYFKSRNLIGMKYTDFLELIDEKPNSEDIIYVIRGNRGQNQKVYDFDLLGLQIWVYKNKVMTVFCSN